VRRRVPALGVRRAAPSAGLERGVRQALHRRVPQGPRVN
jgi:hypothetical protein